MFLNNLANKRAYRKLSKLELINFKFKIIFKYDKIKFALLLKRSIYSPDNDQF